MTKSGAEIGREYTAILAEYLASIDDIPSRGGKPHMTAIARACGFDRRILYKNPACVNLLDAAVAERGLDERDTRKLYDVDPSDWVPASKLREAEQRNSTLEKKVSEQRARIVGLEALLRRREIIDEELISRGRRSMPSSGPLFERNVE